MKRILIIMMCATFSFTMMYAQKTKKKSNKETVVFLIKNMHCQNCVEKVEKNIAFEKGVTNLTCDLSTLTVEVTYRTDKTTEDQLVRAFDKIGMKAQAMAEGENSESHDPDGHTQELF